MERAASANADIVTVAEKSIIARVIVIRMYTHSIIAVIIGTDIAIIGAGCACDF